MHYAPQGTATPTSLLIALRSTSGRYLDPIGDTHASFNGVFEGADGTPNAFLAAPGDDNAPLYTCSDANVECGPTERGAPTVEGFRTFRVPLNGAGTLSVAWWAGAVALAHVDESLGNSSAYVTPVADARISIGLWGLMFLDATGRDITHHVTYAFASGITPQSNTVPEPTSLALLGAGLAGLVPLVKRRGR